MILKTALKQYLNAPRDDYSLWKELKFAELRGIKNELPFKPPIYKKLRKEQRACFLIGVSLRRFAFWLDTGIGKTLLSIALARYFKRAGIAKRLLVLVPNTINGPEWAREIRKHAPATKFVVLKGSSKKKWQQLNQSDDLLVIVTYGGLVRMLCDTKKVKKRNRKRLVPKLVPNKSRVQKFVKMFDGFFSDESDHIGNHRALATRILWQLAKHDEKIVVLLSGTPFGKDPLPLWSQMRLVDKGETLGNTLGLFRAAFYKEKKNYFSGFPEYTFDKKQTKKVNKMLSHRSIRYDADESTLPKVVPIKKEYDLPQEAQAYYDAAKAKLIAAHGNYREMENTFMRMRQISSGFLGYYDDEEGVKAKFAFDENPKLDGLMDSIQHVRKDYKIVLFHEFVYSGDLIEERLKHLGIGHVRLTKKVKDEGALLAKFDKDPECRVFQINNSKGAYGLNLQKARYFMYYESPVRPIIRKQTRRRVERQYSKYKKVFMYDFIVRRTYDQRILDSLEKGQDLFKSIMQGKRDGLVY